AEHRTAIEFASKYDGQVVPVTALPQADITLLSVRPEQAEAALSNVDWNGVTILSAMAGRSLADLQAAAPGAKIVRAMPISAAALCASPTPLYPSNTLATALLELVGAVIPFDDETIFEAACANAAAYGWIFALIEQLENANQKAGLSAPLARQMTAETLRAAASVAAEHDGSMGALLNSLATPGGITAHGLDVLEKANALHPWAKAFDSVADRLARK
ncbi:MAG: pyrroline-5-carboxylate reductase family protein, partial [Pikeienuella sp.]